MVDFTSNLLSDKAKAEGLYSFSEGDMFDRIINLKLTTKAYVDGEEIKHDEYVIRSDWELYYPGIGKVATQEASTSDLKHCYVRRFIHKPSIKVQYKQIASGTAVEIDIFVHNFIMLSEDGRSFMSFNNLTYPIGQVEVQMGYFGQFNKKPESLEEYFDFKNKLNVDTLTVDVGHGYVQTDKLPPDGVLHIHGYVGSCYNPPLIELQGKEVKESVYDTVKNPLVKYNNYAKDYLFTNVTRRFLRKPISPKGVKVNENNGMMSVEDAEKYGVKVFMSTKLEAVCTKAEERFKAKTSSGENVSKKVIGHYSESVVKAMNLFREDIGVDIGFKALVDGNYIAYLSSETMDSEELAKTLQRYKAEDTDLIEAGSVVERIYKNILPAVSNITTDALCTIVCPFFYFLNPFDMIKFKSRYALGGIVSYYANFSAEESKFYALYMSVSFATVEDVNECTIVCTGSKE